MRRKRVDLDTLPPLCFAVLAALAHEPMVAGKGGTKRNLCSKLQASQPAVYRAVRALESLGWIVRRDDGKWALRVLLAPVALSPRSMGTMPSVDDSVPGDDPVLGPDYAKPVGGAEPSVLTRTTRVPLPKLTELPTEAISPSTVASRWNLPPSLPLGVFGVGKRAACSRCENLTPVKYGGVPLCPACARRESSV